MAATLNADWGPYIDAVEAERYLSRFINNSCGPEVGIAWVSRGTVYPLRAPRRDGDGVGVVAAFEWSQSPPPPPKPPSGFWGKVKAFLVRALEQQGEAQIAEAEANLAMGRAIGRVFERMGSNKMDGVGVALDILCVAASIALLPTGLGMVGLVGLFGGSLLLYTDGKAYGMELAGDDEGAEAYKKQTEKMRIFATILTLPDLAYGGFKAVRELQEIREMRVLDRTTASAATNMAARTEQAARAERLAQIAERANLRAQLRTKQIMASIKLEMVPRAAGSIATGLLLKDEIKENESVMQEFFRRLHIHCVALHRS